MTGYATLMAVSEKAVGPPPGKQDTRHTWVFSVDLSVFMEKVTDNTVIAVVTIAITRAILDAANLLSQYLVTRAPNGSLLATGKNN